MDIIELSHKLEGNLLESDTDTAYDKTDCNARDFSPRLTRSKLSHKEVTIAGAQENLVNATVTQLSSGKMKGGENLEKIYLNKVTKVAHKNLETIYENPIWKKGSTVLIGTSKVKRSLYLDREFRRPGKVKSKLRKSKVKKLGKKFKTMKITDDEFRSKMQEVENYINDANVESNITHDSCDSVNDVQMHDNNRSGDNIHLEMDVTMLANNNDGVIVNKELFSH